MAQKSIVVLFTISFLIGLMQPILPLVEYYVFKESIIELFCENRDEPETECEGSCYLTNQLKKNEGKSDSPGNLINFEDIPNVFLTRSPVLTRLMPPDDTLQMYYQNHRPDTISYQVFHPPRS